MTVRRILTGCLLIGFSCASALAQRGPEPASSQAQVTRADPEVCTDLSGRYRLPCPGQPKPQPSSPSASAGAIETPANRALSPANATPVPIGSGSSSAYDPPRIAADRGQGVPPGPALKNVPSDLVHEQVDLWTSPLRLRLHDVQWLAPLMGATAIFMASDRDIERKLPTSASLIKRSNSASTYGAAAFAGLTGGAYLLGRMTSNDRLTDTALWSGEAAANTFAITYAIKSMARRSRPDENGGAGRFGSGGSSFPSEHAAAAWSIATVVAHQYPGPLTQLLAYGGATGITAARVLARKHFASDVFVGSVLGWAVGREVYRSQSRTWDQERFGTFERAPRAEGPRDPDNMGSSYVPLDSWAYPAIERLVALGYIRGAFLGLRPWTRMECARLLTDAADRIHADTGVSREALALYDSLAAEFALEGERQNGASNVSATLESVYTRVTGISGTPLRDSFHFGQTIINDYGRPYGEGFNSIMGVTSHAEAGPLVFYVRAEYQHAASAPQYSSTVRQAVAETDPVPAGFAAGIVDQGRLLDAYVALNISNNQISFGKQSVWWGPGTGGAMLFSNNAEPFYMLRWTQGHPFKLPGPLGIFGTMRTDFFIGRLAGHLYPNQPYIDAQKITMQPTENLELGFSKLSVFGGGGIPLGWRNFWKSVASAGDHKGQTAAQDPGDRRAGFDFRYRIPKLRKWLTVYSDSFADDEPSPLSAPRRSAFNPGIYLTQVPGIPKLDFRAEYAATDVNVGADVNGEFFYTNSVYRDSHTNKGNLLGSWVGREGKGLQAWSTYWFSPRNTIQVGYRNLHVAKDFVGGGTLNDLTTRADWLLRGNLGLSASVQYEWWKYPLLATDKQSNITASMQVTYWLRHTVK